MDIVSLRSGSRGNAALIFSDKTKILVDCGVSGKVIEEALSSLDISPRDIDGIVVTHEHSDHISGIGVMMRRYKLPVWANEDTWLAMEGQIGKIDSNLEKIHNGEFEIGDIGIKSFNISHDAAAPIGYSFQKGEEKVSVATDIGILKKDIFEVVKKSKTVLLEANHDVNMLEIGRYPEHLKRRIRGDFGHLSNDDAGKAAEFLVRLGTENIILGHLSEENNYPNLAEKTVELALAEAEIIVGRDVKLSVASQYDICRI